MDDIMTIDGKAVRALREQHAWSQEHLATVAGLSLRTIQRVEADGTASLDTRMAIAAAFAIAPAHLLPAAPPVDPAAAVLASTASGKDAGTWACSGQRQQIGVSLLWAVAIIATALTGGPSILGTLILPTLAVASLLLLERKRSERR